MPADLPRTAMQTFSAGIEDRAERAARKFRMDEMFYRHVDMVVAYALQRHGPIDPEEADRAAHRIAIEVAALLLQTVYEEDSLVKNLEAERDRFREVASKAAMTTPFFLHARRPDAG